MRVVQVTWHALEQFRSRFPQEAGSSSQMRLLIAKEVDEALDHNRYSTRQPKWCREDGARKIGKRNGDERDRSLRFVWTENHKRVYLVDKAGIETRVVTSIRPDGR